jgi:hypothetical protein
MPNLSMRLARGFSRNGSADLKPCVIVGGGSEALPEEEASSFSILWHALQLLLVAALGVIFLPMSENPRIQPGEKGGSLINTKYHEYLNFN